MAPAGGAGSAGVCSAGKVAAAGVVGGYAFSWGLRPPASQAPLSGLPAHASSLLRLADGVARRAGVLRVRRPAFSALAQDAEDAARSARAAGEDDGLAQRLLELASTLDDALAQETGEKGRAA